MGWFRNLWNDVMGGSSSVNTHMLEPGHSKKGEPEKEISSEQIATDILTLKGIINDWNDAHALYDSVRDGTTIIIVHKRTVFWRDKISKNAWTSGWSLALRRIDKFSENHREECSDLFSRYGDSKKQLKVLENIDETLSEIKSEITEHIIPMRDNPNLSSNLKSQESSQAPAQQIFRFRQEIDLKYYTILSTFSELNFSLRRKIK